MTASDADSRFELRHAVYWLMLLASVGVMTGRVLTVRSSLGKTPLLSANDRSRWCTVRALVDHGTYEIDDVIFLDPQLTKRDREWYTIDMVRHRGRDGREHYYSSKPPLLPTLLAGVYWGLRAAAGVTLADHPFYAVRAMLLMVHVIPLGIYLLLMMRLIERYGASDEGRLLTMAVACFGTLLTTFAVTLNNHVVAAICVAVVVYLTLPIWRNERSSGWCFAGAGLFAAFAAANELPALSLLFAVTVVVAIRNLRLTLLAFAPAVVVVAVAFFATNYAAHQSWRPPYMHRGDGEEIVFIEGDFGKSLTQGDVPPSLRAELQQSGIDLSEQAAIAPRLSGQSWMIWDSNRQHRLAIELSETGLRVRDWDHWYEYERSYWLDDRKTGVDLGEPSRLTYAMNLLIGHHGILSLTPFWLLSGVGLWLWWRRPEDNMRGFVAAVVGLTAVCLVFYILRPLRDRNYGGVTCGFRWMIWFVPLWLCSALPAADLAMKHRWWRKATLAMLLISVVSASYALLNPWTHPWIYKYWAYMGGVEL